jgi:predicted XRE-type DNA-binding protein
MNNIICLNKIDFDIQEDTGCFICNSHKPGKRGYPRVNVSIDNKKKTTPLHRIVYEFYNGKIPKNRKVMVRHTCDNKMCINPKHLLLGTHQDNVNDAKKNRKILRGEQKPNSKLTAKKVLEIRELKKYKKITEKEIAKIFNISRGCVSSILRGKSWYHLY